MKGPSGGQFSTAYAKTPLEWIEYRAKQLPGPQDYYPRESLKENSFRFSEAKPKSDVGIMIFIYVIANLRMAFLEKLALITNYKNHGMMPLSGPSNPHLEDLGRLQNVNGLGGI